MTVAPPKLTEAADATVTHDARSLAVATMDARDDAPLPSSSSSSEEDDDEQEEEELDPEGVN